MNIAHMGSVTTVHLNVFSGFEQWLCLMSDNHYDSIECDRELMTRHFKKVEDRKALVLMTGDWFDAMQGKFDPRRSMAELREEYRRDDYYDYVVKDSYEYLRKYKQYLMVMGDGNHERSVLKNANTNLMDRLVGLLRLDGSPVIHGGYGGWVRLRLDREKGHNQKNINIKYFHGAGGDAPVTRGVIHTNRQAVYLPDADIVVNGHNHNQYYVAITRERINGYGRPYKDIQHHIRVPGYKDGYEDGSNSWEVSRGGVPKPLGCVWVKITTKFGDVLEVGVEVTPDLSPGKQELPE